MLDLKIMIDNMRSYRPGGTSHILPTGKHSIVLTGVGFTYEVLATHKRIVPAQIIMLNLTLKPRNPVFLTPIRLSKMV